MRVRSATRLFLAARRPLRTLAALAAIGIATAVLGSVPLPGMSGPGALPPFAFLFAPMFLPVVLVLGLSSSAAWVERDVGWVRRRRLLYAAALSVLAVVTASASAPGAYASSPAWRDFTMDAPPALVDLVATAAQNAMSVVGLTLICVRLLPPLAAWVVPSAAAALAIVAPVPLLELAITRSASTTHGVVAGVLLAAGLCLAPWIVVGERALAADDH